MTDDKDPMPEEAPHASREDALPSPDAAPASRARLALGAAMEWKRRLTAADVREEDEAAFAQWLAQSAVHEDAWARVNRLPREGEPQPAWGRASRTSRDLGPLPNARRALLGGMLGIGVALTAGLMVDHRRPLNQWMADLYTGTGERQTHRLPDGTTLMLNARSAVDVEYDEAQRKLRLRAGAITLDVNDEDERPFSIHTPHGVVHTLGGQLVMSVDVYQSAVSVLTRQVSVTAVRGEQRTLVAGEGVHVSLRQWLDAPESPREAAAWTQGQAVLVDAPLGELVKALRPYRAGALRVAPDAAALRVSGEFALDDPDATLAALVAAYPVELRTLGPWWVSIRMR